MRKFVLKQIANGWLVTDHQKTTWYYPKLELAIKSVENPVLDVEIQKFRKGEAQVDMEDYLKTKTTST